MGEKVDADFGDPRRILTSIVDWVSKHRSDLLLFVFGAAVTIVSCLHYLATMLIWTEPGFTLDDSWIHLQFAKTIYEARPWQYSPGYPSTGSTSPLWSIVLVPLFLLSQDPTQLVLGTYFIMTVLYALTTSLVALLISRVTHSHLWGHLGCIAFVLMPRNTWLMLSGMETPLFMFLLMLGITLIAKQDITYDILLGGVMGLAYLARPEGILLALFALLIRPIFLHTNRVLDKRRILSLLGMVFTAILVASPWIFHCLSVTGFPLPDTFYAKVHVPSESEIETWNFFWRLWIQQYPFIIIAFIAVPFLIKARRPLAWLLGMSLLLLYRFSNPYGALINNARYLVPVFSFLLISAFAGTAVFFQMVFRQFESPKKPDNTVVIGVVLCLLFVVPSIPGYLQQAPFYGNAVKNINEQQVHIGRWIEQNTPEDAVLAIHDAGALRFFSNRSVIDLAGLVSPEIIHGNMSARETLLYLKERGCNYFVFFDELFTFWALHLHGAYEKLYSMHLEDNVISGRDTMSVFRINWNETGLV
ncbi:MAG: hypothetical protein R6V83_08500 [Candidatus Thorarchaeota archaeon]